MNPNIPSLPLQYWNYNMCPYAQSLPMDSLSRDAYQNFNRNMHNSSKLSVQMLLLRTMQGEALLGASISKKYNLPLVLSMLQVLRLQNLHIFNSRRLLKRILLARSFGADFPKDIVTVLKWSRPLKMPQTQLLMSFYSFCFYLYLINPYMPKIEWVPCFFSFSFPKNY